MKFFRFIGSFAFVVGLFTAIFVGGLWHVYYNPMFPWWLKIAIYCLLGGILLVLLTVALEQKKGKAEEEELPTDEIKTSILLQNSAQVPGSEITKVLGLVKGHTIFAIWIGKDLSAIVRLVLGGELIEYTEMMGKARTVASNRMIAQAEELGADAIINVRFVTTSVIGSAAELLAYGTAVKLKKAKT
ncbi:MAG: YbjQ family protein [Candidatus Caldatribacteriota bacterium]|nr:YbjQ family protein [Candidatus Caldatribacteriota bacterium]